MVLESQLKRFVSSWNSFKDQEQLIGRPLGEKQERWSSKTKAEPESSGKDWYEEHRRCSDELNWKHSLSVSCPDSTDGTLAPNALNRNTTWCRACVTAKSVNTVEFYSCVIIDSFIQYFLTKNSWEKVNFENIQNYDSFSQVHKT